MSEIDSAISESEIIVNATPIGMAVEAPLFNTDLLTPAHLVCDLVYQPAMTPLLEAAERLKAKRTRRITQRPFSRLNRLSR